MTMQLTITGEVLKQAGIDQVSLSNESFLESMRTIAKGISILRGQVSCDDLREAAEKAKLRPHHPNAWGAVLSGKGWVQVGRKVSTHPSNHGREIRVWKWEGDQ